MAGTGAAVYGVGGCGGAVLGVGSCDLKLKTCPMKVSLKFGIKHEL